MLYLEYYMKVSLNIVKQFIDFELPPVDELVERINEQLGGVEDVISLGAKYKDPIIVRVVECEKHPNADRLNVTKIDDGGVTPNVPRDDNGFVQVVCGAPNVHADMLAVWLPPGSTVPASFDDPEQFVLSARELRGVLSQGMLAAPDELALGTSHEGLLEINPGEWKPNDIEIKPGVSFASVYGLDDTIIDIENKMFTHRPDLFGQIGVAREIAGILGHKFTSPSWYIDAPKFEVGTGLELEVFNDGGDYVPRAMFVAMKNITIGESPTWLRAALVAMGSKSINNIVDVTNYVMLLTAQPTHAYDYDKIRGHKIGARMARSGEKIKLLNDKTYELSEDDIVIADAEGAIGLGGIMGGGDSEVDDTTKSIVLEVATFDMYAVRKSAMRHGVFTDALTRFNKGQSPLQNDHIMSLLIASIKDVSPAELASEVSDLGGPKIPQPVELDRAFINDRLGLDLQSDAIKRLLENVELLVSGEFSVTPPFWRTDIELPEDVVEEVGRLYGFDKLPRVLPLRSIQPAPVSTTLQTKRRIRESLSRAGANEVLTYSFVHENILKHADQNPEKAFRLGNALSPDLQYYRISVLPSLLDKVHMNIRAGYDEFALFEIGKGHHKDAYDDEGLPIEFARTAGVYANKKDHDGAAYYHAKRLFEEAAREFGFEAELKYQKLTEFDFGDHDMLTQMAMPFDPERSSMVWVGERFGGIVGELKSSVRKGFKLPTYTAGFELFLSLFEKALLADKKTYRPLSKFPSVSQDISLKVAEDVSYQAMLDEVKTALDEADGELQVDVSPTVIYQADGSATRTMTFHMTVTSFDRTLRDSDVAPLVDQIAGKTHDKFGAELV